MKRMNQNFYSVILLMLILSFVTGCKKDSNDPVTPVFTVTATTVDLTSGGQGLQFSAVCTNTDVVMQTIRISNPTSAFTNYDCKSTSYLKNAGIPMEGTNEAYPKMTGTWSFRFTGTAGGKAFTVDNTLQVSK
jgi:hypothetical protein